MKLRIMYSYLMLTITKAYLAIPLATSRVEMLCPVCLFLRMTGRGDPGGGRESVRQDEGGGEEGEGVGSMLASIVRSTHLPHTLSWRGLD